MQVGFKLFAEAYAPLELVQHAVLAEQAGFDFVEMSDHFHPWFERDGDSPLAGHSGFTWSVLAMIAARTRRIRLGTGVTCPTVRYHPAIIAQAAATMAILAEGRFFLGVGSGERLNEHIVGKGWNSVPVRHEMLREALHIITTLWRGGFHSYRGEHLQIEDARIYDLPDDTPDIVVAASGGNAARIAADYGGMFLTSPDTGVVNAYRRQGGGGTIYGEALTGYDPTSKEAGRQAARRSIRWAGLGTVALSEIPRASIFEYATRHIQPSELDSIIVSGPDPADYLARAETFADAGIDGIVFVNGSEEVNTFLEFAGRQLIPAIHSMQTRTSV